jgi:NADPH:quinone reductase-like Zn-dependent oxidoreductase
MKTWELQSFGLSNIRQVERAIPKPGPKQILVKVKAVSLNFRDKAIADGIYLPEIMKMPMVPVSDAAGIVIETGREVTRFKTGDRVISHLYSNWVSELKPPARLSFNALGGPIDGGLTEYMILPESGAIHTPSGLSDAEAATLPIAALTAWFALVDHGQLKAGQTIVTQGTGGVSLFGIQLASALGARVIALSGSDEKLIRAKALGAAETINYRKHPEWQQQVLELTDGQGADNILDVVGGSSLNRSVQALTEGGQLSVIGFLESITANLDLLPVIFKATQVQGILVGNRDAFEAMNKVIEKHAIRPVIDTVYSFADVHAAFAHLERGAIGKIVIQVSE